MARLSRRSFGALLAAAGPAAAALAAQQNPTPAAPGNFRRPLAPETPAFEGTAGVHAENRRAPGGALSRCRRSACCPTAFTTTRRSGIAATWQRLAADRLLYTFRANAGLPVGSAKPLGGWEQPENGQRSSELRGHFPGHFLSASAQLAANGDKDAKAKGDYMVAEMAKCQQKLGGKYLSAFPTTWWDRLEKGERVWAPFYTIHKIMAGMFDMYSLAGNQQALQVLEGMAAWADEWTAPKTEEHMQQILTIEFGGIAETLYRLAAATNNDRWAKVGDRFQKKSFLNPLAARRDELRGLHVNTHIPQVIAAARRYDLSGDMRFHDVADYFFYEVTTARTYVTGGTSNAEAWLAPPRRLAAELKLSVNTAECCCAYNMLKLARHLYGWNPNPTYFDYYEHLLLNHRIGTIRPKIGIHAVLPLPDARRLEDVQHGGPDVLVLHRVGRRGIFQAQRQHLLARRRGPVRQPVHSLGIGLDGERLQTPAGDEVSRVPEHRSDGDRRARRARSPSGCEFRDGCRAAPSVKVNGKVLDASAAPGSYLVLKRAWKAGDRIEMELPMHLRVEAMPDDPSMQAFLYGPLVLAGDLGGEGLTEAHIIGPNLRVGAPNTEQFGSPLGPTNTTPPVPEIEIPTFRASGADPSSWIKPADGPLTFRTTGQKKDVTLVPLNSLFDRRYSVYWQVS